MNNTGTTKTIILRMAAVGPVDASGCSRSAGITLSAAYKHLKELVETGMLERFTDGHFRNRIYYRLTRFGCEALLVTE